MFPLLQSTCLLPLREVLPVPISLQGSDSLQFPVEVVVLGPTRDPWLESWLQRNAPQEAEKEAVKQENGAETFAWRIGDVKARLREVAELLEETQSARTEIMTKSVQEDISLKEAKLAQLMSVFEDEDAYVKFKNRMRKTERNKVSEKESARNGKRILTKPPLLYSSGGSASEKNESTKGKKSLQETMLCARRKKCVCSKRLPIAPKCRLKGR